MHALSFHNDNLKERTIIYEKKETTTNDKL